MKNSPSNVLVVDDDVGIHRALAKLLELAGFAMHGFLSAEDFLTAEKPEGPGCLLLDMKMPGMNGLVLQRAMATSERKYPIIFLTGNGDVHSCADAMKMGAVDFFTKPCSPDELIDAIERALRLDIAASELRDNRRSIEQRVATLTRRETQVMQHVATGLLNKQIAFELGTSVKTVKIHRARVMAKMRARSLADLVKFAAAVDLGISSIFTPQLVGASQTSTSQSLNECA
jgi:FixJ family two-component response regulator